MSEELTVEEALKELREMFPDTFVSVRRQEYVNTNYDTALVGAEIYINQGQSPPSCHAVSLTECMAEVRRWYAGQKGMLFCSCGASCNEEEYAKHRAMGHDSGME